MAKESSRFWKFHRGSRKSHRDITRLVEVLSHGSEATTVQPVLDRIKSLTSEKTAIQENKAVMGSWKWTGIKKKHPKR